MFAKFTILLLVVSVIYARQISTSPNVSDEIDDLLKRLEEALDLGVSIAKGLLQEAKNTLNQTATDVEAITRDALGGIEKKFQEEIDDLKTRAKNASVDVDECFGQDETTLMHLPDVAADEMVKCVEGYILKAFSDVDDALDRIKNTTDDLIEFKNDIENCNNDSKCLNELAVKIERDIVTLPIEIAKDAKDVIEMVRHLVPEIQKCGTDAIGKCETSGQKLLDKITQCVNNKIGH